MTRRYEEEHYNRKTDKMEHTADWSFTIYPGDNNHLTVSRDGVTKTVKVVPDIEFVYKLQKTQVRAIGGAEGLYNFLDRELFECSTSCMAWKVLRHCFFDCKAAA
jgi:hypothetical protein